MKLPPVPHDLVTNRQEGTLLGVSNLETKTSIVNLWGRNSKDTLVGMRHRRMKPIYQSQMVDSPTLVQVPTSLGGWEGQFFLRISTAQSLYGGRGAEFE